MVLLNMFIFEPKLSGADPGFPRWGANLLFGQIFQKNCMKVEEILGVNLGRRGGGASKILL